MLQFQPSACVRTRLSQHVQELRRLLDVHLQGIIDPIQPLRSALLDDTLLRHWHGEIVFESILGLDHEALVSLSASRRDLVHEVVDGVRGVAQVSDTKLVDHGRQIGLGILLQGFERSLGFFLELDHHGLRSQRLLALVVPDNDNILWIYLEGPLRPTEKGNLRSKRWRHRCHRRRTQHCQDLAPSKCILRTSLAAGHCRQRHQAGSCSRPTAGARRDRNLCCSCRGVGVGRTRRSDRGRQWRGRRQSGPRPCEGDGQREVREQGQQGCGSKKRRNLMTASRPSGNGGHELPHGWHCEGRSRTQQRCVCSAENA
mmetsp:Transcript_36603/g.79905  ORF Transcript_36603/g.79905 Transcript_36603/m.79905 type:complete len:314 (-) Transcript_36603:2-943(-)